jgi:very-short-patch-repair endonuclease
MVPDGTDSRTGPRQTRQVAGRAILDAARQLRHEQTRPEELLWERLRQRRLQGAKFRRQHPLAGYVLDFYCHSARLAVEVDGRCHEIQDDADAERDAYLALRGVRVLRLPAHLVLGDIDAALDAIRAALG